jgi:putative FmdB family regulatory protein
MPTYDYRCGACDGAFEFFQSMTEGAKRKCPACGKPKLVRQIGAGAAILFKGSGFYQTDYRSDSYKKSASAESSAPKPDSPAGASCTGEPTSCASSGGPCAAPEASSSAKPEKPAKKTDSAARKKG